MALTTQQRENIQIDYGIIYLDYGETTQQLLGPTRGGGTFKVTKNIRDIDYDGRPGKTKRAQVVDEINASLTVTHLDTSIDTLGLAIPFAIKSENKLICSKASMGILPDAAYMKNVTMFAKTVGGKYKKITLYNAMNESDLELAAVPKGEGTVGLEIFAHWDSEDDEQALYEIEDVNTIAGT